MVKNLNAKVVRKDPILDLAVLEIDGTDVKKVATLVAIITLLSGVCMEKY